MTTVASGTCRKCGAVKSFDDFQFFTFPIFGDVVDFGIYHGTVTGGAYDLTQSGSTTWACVYDTTKFLNTSCFDDMRNDPLWAGTTTARVYHEQDQFRQFCIDTVSGVDGTTLSGMLPGGSIHPDFQITQADIDVFYDDLQGKLDQLYPTGSGVLATTILRNLLTLPISSGIGIGLGAEGGLGDYY